MDRIKPSRIFGLIIIHGMAADDVMLKKHSYGGASSSEGGPTSINQTCKELQVKAKSQRGSYSDLHSNSKPSIDQVHPQNKSTDNSSPS